MAGVRYQEEGFMSGTGRETPTGLNEFQVAIVEKLYGTMKDFDAGRTKQTVESIVDRDTTAASRLRALLDDLWPLRPSNLAA